MKSNIVIFLLLFSVNVFAQKKAKNIPSFQQAKTVKTKNILTKQIDSLMATSFERDLFNGNVLVAKGGKSSIKNHLVLQMKPNKLLYMVNQYLTLALLQRNLMP